MAWKVRPIGSPLTIDNLTINQVAEGLMEDKWETSDHVMGPGDKQFVPIDSHPQLAEIALEVEAAKVDKEGEDPEEQRIDMNPLIDVCLVLLVFFILATTMSVLEKVLDLPKQNPPKEGENIPTVSKENVKQYMVMVEAKKEGGQATFKVDDKPVTAEALEKEVKSAVAAKRSNQNPRPSLVIDAVGVDWGSVVQVIDAAAGANCQKVQFLKHSRGRPPAPGGQPPGASG
jgi:biopolymer transport protein ExbD